jgi:hypothetical protein
LDVGDDEVELVVAVEVGDRDPVVVAGAGVGSGGFEAAVAASEQHGNRRLGVIGCQQIDMSVAVDISGGDIRRGLRSGRSD